MSEVILGIVCLPAQTVFVVIYQKKKLRNCYTEWVFYKLDLYSDNFQVFRNDT
jgi:hypothetical protein